VLARCSGRLVLSALALAVGLLVGPLLAGHASAYLGVCATDPVVVLSDGMRVTVTTAIVDTPKDVRSVVYTIHAPAGVTLNHVHSWGRLHRVERVQVAGDQAPGSYRVDTVVSTGTAGVAVTTTATLTDTTLGVVVDLRSVSGVSGQTVAVSLAG
jgi:hypothetical protein